MEIPVLHHDAALLVVNKPAGVLSIPAQHYPEHPHLRGALESRWGRLWIVHRLDCETSGALVLARSAEAHRALNAQFQRRQAAKTYHALVWGAPPWQETVLDAPLRANVGSRHRTVVDTRRGKAARTNVRVLRRGGTWTLVEACPLHGRRHQIRAHLYAAGFPLVGDPLYGNGSPPRQEWPLPRLGLHARSLELQHPLTGLPAAFLAPYPPDFRQALHRL